MTTTTSWDRSPSDGNGNHTFGCALPMHGGVCNCQPGHNATADPWPPLSDHEAQHHGKAEAPSARFRPRWSAPRVHPNAG